MDSARGMGRVAFGLLLGHQYTEVVPSKTVGTTSDVVVGELLLMNCCMNGCWGS